MECAVTLDDYGVTWLGLDRLVRLWLGLGRLFFEFVFNLFGDFFNLLGLYLVARNIAVGLVYRHGCWGWNRGWRGCRSWSWSWSSRCHRRSCRGRRAWWRLLALGQPFI